jgi:hypothetical protein
MGRRELSIPLVDGILVAHTEVTPRTNRDKVLNRHSTPFALRSIVTTLIVEHGHLVCAPNNPAFRIELATHFQ